MPLPLSAAYDGYFPDMMHAMGAEPVVETAIAPPPLPNAMPMSSHGGMQCLADGRASEMIVLTREEYGLLCLLAGISIGFLLSNALVKR